MANTKGGAGSNGESMNKSNAIRAAIAETPQAGPKEIVNRLAERGVKVSSTLVYYIKSQEKRKKRQLKRERVAKTSQGTGAANPVELVLRVKSLARDAGGIKDLKRLVDALA